MTARTVAWHCPPKTVLVGVDFGDASARALAIAGVVAAGFDARLRVLHAERFEPPPYFTVEQIGYLEAAHHAATASAAAHLAHFATAASGLAVESVVADTPPVDALLSGSATVDLIVLGTHGRRGPGRWWLGSVAERVVRAATTPVLVARAAVTPPRAVFERLVLVQNDMDADAAARMCAEHFAGLAGGSVTNAGPLAQCDAALLRQASLIVMATPGHSTSWGFPDAVTKVLGACDRPVLFMPPFGDESETDHDH
jgi:nucleotide-binding universal stress UspA family protein